jgi:uncharacterized protein (TIGR03067 family)
MRARILLVVLACLFTCLHPLTVRAADDNKGLEQLRGTWTVTKADPKFEAKKMIFDGEKLTMVFSDKPGDSKSVTIKVDPQPKPAQIDFVTDREKSPGIYEVSGDTLKICFAAGATNRPTEFKSADDIIFVTLQREKKQP